MSKAIRKIDLMHRQFGKDETHHLCGECNNLIQGRYHDKTYRKCKVYGMTHSEASDWAKSWSACGCYNKEYNGRPIIELVRKGGPVVTSVPLENQLSFMFGGAERD